MSPPPVSSGCSHDKVPLYGVCSSNTLSQSMNVGGPDVFANTVVTVTLLDHADSNLGLELAVFVRSRTS